MTEAVPVRKNTVPALTPEVAQKAIQAAKAIKAKREATPEPELVGFAFDPEQHIVVGENVFARDSLTEQMQIQVSHINWADQEIANTEQTARLLRIGRDQLVYSLVQMLAEGEVPIVATALPEGQTVPLPFEPSEGDDEEEQDGGEID